jgi:hypothetical protein
MKRNLPATEKNLVHCDSVIGRFHFITVFSFNMMKVTVHVMCSVAYFYEVLSEFM